MTTDPELVKNSDCLMITKENLVEYGFACFHQPGEGDVKDGFWRREIEVDVGGAKGAVVQEFMVPEKLCIELSQTNKIVASGKFEIKLSSNAAETIALLARRAGWNQTMADLEAMQRYYHGGFFIACYNLDDVNIPLGCGVSLPVSVEHCWIGMILVHTELRRQGIARSIMNACLKHARLVQKKSVIGLDATPLGKRVYDSLGFRDSITIWRSTISTSWKTISSSMDSPSQFKHDSAKKYLLERNYIERVEIIETLANLPGSKNMMMVSKDEIHGFVMSRPGRLKPFVGPLIADSCEVAQCLLIEILKHWKNLGHEDVFMDIPEYHYKDSIFSREQIRAEDCGQKIPVIPARSFMRMYQLISAEQENPEMDHEELFHAIKSYEKTETFMRKEKNDILAILYGTSGPEWS